MSRILTYSLCGALICLTVLACKPPAPAGLSEADKAAIQKVVDEAIAIASAETKDWATYARTYYAEDAVVMPPNSPSVQGRAAIESLFAAFPAISDLKFELLKIEGLGDLAYVHGTYSMMLTLPDAPTPIKDSGKYIEIWRKQADGSWKVIRDIFNSDLPLPAVEVPEAEKK